MMGMSPSTLFVLLLLVEADALVWPFGAWKAWRIVKDAFPDAYPHYFRFSYITEAASDPDVSLTDLRAETELHVVTIQRYLTIGAPTRERALRKRRCWMRKRAT